MAGKSYQIRIPDVIPSSPDCSKWTIQWETPECGDIQCDIDSQTILVDVPDGCDNCFYGVATCMDDCDVCGQIPVKICPCTVDSDCKNCETCNQGLGFCVSNCPAGQFCGSCGVCGDCDEEHPCEGGKVCNNCKCECPPTKPFTNQWGKCSECLTKEDCGPGMLCGPDGCYPGDCEIGYFHPTIKECVECYLPGHCTGPNECCIDSKCGCCPGFVRDSSGNCVKDECSGDEDCADCEYCDLTNKKCKPTQCPPGQICYGDGCVDICDCSNPSCPGNAACTPIGNGICACIECTGDCQNGCSDRCYCDGTSCKPNPCGGKCSTGCGPGCKCAEDGTDNCIPCDTPWCGCDQETCDNGFDCGQNCGCDKNSICRRCEDLSCEECGTVDGCACDDGVSCKAKKDCKDELDFEVIDPTCDLKVNATLNGGCSCSPITAVAKATGGTEGTTYSLNFTVELRKGLGNIANYPSLPKLGDLNSPIIAANEKPLSGVLSIRVSTYHNLYDENGNLISAYQYYGAQNYSASFNNADTKNIAGVIVPKIGSATTGYNKVSLVKIELVQTSQFVFPNNCKYQTSQVLGSYQLAESIAIVALTLGAATPIVGAFTSQDKRYPLVSISKSNTNGAFDAAPFRKVYMIPGANQNEFYDIIYGPDNFDQNNAQPLSEPKGLLWSGRSYLFQADCLCASPVDTGKVVFCNPTELLFDVVPNTCQRKIQLKGPFMPCHVNQDVTQWGYPSNSDFQVKYDLYINGAKIATFRHDKVQGMIDASTGQSMFRVFEALDGDFITSIELRINHDDLGRCTLKYDLPPVGISLADIQATIDCQNSTDLYTASFVKSFGAFTISTITGNGITVLSNSGQYIMIGNLMKGVDNKVTIVFTNGCSIDYTLRDNCCNEATVTIDSTGDLCSGASGELTAVTDGFASGITYVWKKGVSTVGTAPSLLVSTAGTYTVTVKDSKGCEKTASIEVGAGISPEFSVMPEIICGSGSTIVTVRGLVGANIQISTPSGITNAVITDPSGIYNLTVNSAPAGEYSLVSYNSGACNYNPGFTKTLQVVSSSNAQFGSVSGGCTGDAIQIEINGGIPGETITLTTVGGIFAGTGSSTKTLTLDSNGYASTNVTYSGAGTKTVEGVSSFGSCTNSMTPVTFSIAQDPQIVSVSHECDNPSPSSNVQLSAVISGVTGLSTVQVKNAATNAVLGTFNLTSGVWTSPLFTPPVNRQVKIVATNGSCTSEFAYTIPACNCPNYFVTLNSDPNIILCNGGAETLSLLDVSPAGTYTYQWFKDGIPIVGETGTSLVVDTSGIYHLQIEDGVCVGESDPVTVTVANAPILTLNTPVPYSSPSTHCNGNLSFSLSTSGAYSGLKWYLDNILQPSFNNLLNATFSFPSAGSHTIKVVTEYGIGCTEEVEYNFSITICCENCMYSIESQDEVTSSPSLLTSFEFISGGKLQAKLKGAVTKTCSFSGVTNLVGTVISEPYLIFDIVAIRNQIEEILSVDIINSGVAQTYNVPAGPARTNMGVLANNLNTLLGVNIFRADGTNLSQFIKTENLDNGFDINGSVVTTFSTRSYVPLWGGSAIGRTRYVSPCKQIEYSKYYDFGSFTYGFGSGFDIELTHNSVTIAGSLSFSVNNNAPGHDPSTPNPGCKECS